LHSALSFVGLWTREGTCWKGRGGCWLRKRAVRSDEDSLSKTRKVRGCEKEAKNVKTDLKART
jgi:hypothetical protein